MVEGDDVEVRSAPTLHPNQSKEGAVDGGLTARGDRVRRGTTSLVGWSDAADSYVMSSWL